MKNAVVMAALFLGACGDLAPAKETGAPPRSVPPGMKVEVFSVADATLQGTTSTSAAKSEGWGGVLGRTRISPGGLNCAIEITDRPLTEEQRAHILAHERRHCAGQQHVTRVVDGQAVLVWLP